MSMFQKGDYRPVPSAFRTLGILSLNELTKFQEKFEIYDTDTTVNAIRDAIVANYLNYDLLNMAKHGFDAKNSKLNTYLEVKQCSISAKRWGGTWNDTNEEKAKAFSDPRLFTAVAVWKGASDLQFLVYGQHVGVGEYLLDRVQNRKSGSRSTQGIAIDTLIKKFGFEVVCPPDKKQAFARTLLINYRRDLGDYVAEKSIRKI